MPSKKDSVDKFFYRGRFFSDEKEMLKYAIEWHASYTDYETFMGLWHDLARDLWLNIQMLDLKISNGELCDILQQNLMYLLTSGFRGCVKDE
jgi:hypothetical protein